MRFFRIFSKGDINPETQKRHHWAKQALFALTITVLFAGCGGCRQCKPLPDEEKLEVIRTPSDNSDLSIVFINGDATLYWTDSLDVFLDHIEITWDRDRLPVNVERGIGKAVIPGLEDWRTYAFTLKAVDRWGNKSNALAGGTGRALKQRDFFTEGPSAKPMGIKGTPAKGQITLSWTNLDDSAYDHIEITYDPNHKIPVRIPKGVESKMFSGLANGLEHTFYITAVDAGGNHKPLDQVGLFIPDHATLPESVFGRPSGGQITLVWKDPADPQLGYLEATFNPNGEAPAIVAKNVQSKTFTGLSDITDYEFTVYATDTEGHRKPLTNVTLFTPTRPSFNGNDADRIVVKGKPVAGQIKLQWNIPAMERLSHIEIAFDPNGIDNPEAVAGGVREKTFFSLSDDTEYSFLVYGVDTMNNNRVINGVKLSTPVLPDLTATPVSGRATLAWTDPDDPKLDYIQLSYSPNTGTPVKIAKKRGTYTFTGLHDNEEYEFKVDAVTTEGNAYAVATARVLITRLPVLIGAPTNGRISLAWTDPADINIDHVEIICSPNSEQARVIAKGIENLTFTGLSDNTEYTFTIYALNSVGNRYPVRSPKFYDPNAAIFVRPTGLMEQTSTLRPPAWKPTNSAVFNSSTIHALAFGYAANGIGRWVAGGTEGKLAYSDDDGLNWRGVVDSTFGYFSIDTIGYGNGRWIAGGKNAKMAWSTNAIVWNPIRRANVSVIYNINTVAFGNGYWIAGGSDGVLLRSEDNGITWNPIDTKVFGQSAINTVVFHEGRWVAGGTRGRLAYSDNNGLTWTGVEAPSYGNSAINVVIHGKERWLAAGYGQRVLWSDDGTVWQPLARPFYILCMGYNGRRWIVGGQEGRMAWSSDSGDSWIVDEMGRTIYGESWVHALAFGMTASGRGRWLSGGQNGRIIYADE